jgi:hypothetical protein
LSRWLCHETHKDILEFLRENARHQDEVIRRPERVASVNSKGLTKDAEDDRCRESVGYWRKKSWR